MRNVFEAIRQVGHDEDFAPRETLEFSPTDAPVGSREKIDVLAERVEQGLPLWHPKDWPRHWEVRDGKFPPDSTKSRSTSSENA